MSIETDPLGKGAINIAFGGTGATTAEGARANLGLVAGPQGPQGPQGIQGDQGDKGDTGTPGSLPENNVWVGNASGVATPTPTDITSIKKLTQSEYDALSPKAETTLYVIVDG